MLSRSTRSSISYLLLLFFTTASIFELQAITEAHIAQSKKFSDQQLEKLSFTIKRYSKDDLQSSLGKWQAKRLMRNKIYALEMHLKNQGEYPITITDIITNLKQVSPEQLNKVLALDGFSKFLQVVGALLSGSILFPLFLITIPLLTLLALMPLLAFVSVVCPPLSPAFGVLGMAAVICSPFLATHGVLSAQLNGLFDQLPGCVSASYPKILNPGQECTQLLFVKTEELYKPCRLMVLTSQKQCASFAGYIN